jgi:lipoprotein-anchoring transpeptidase ErfK/SrfK
MLLAVAGCSGSGSAPQAAGLATAPSDSASVSPSPVPLPTATAPTLRYPKGPPMYLDSIAPLSGTTVGVAMPISMVFTHPVKVSARERIERHIKLTTSVPVSGAWHWFGSQRVDFRPKRFWKPGTTVSMVARFNHVGDGFGRYGTHSYTRDFRIGADVRTHVFVKKHTTVVRRNGTVLRSMPSNAGSSEFPTWDGTMAVVDTERTVRMTSCSVGIACDKNDPNFYDLVLPWDVRLTWSGTFVHYSTADPSPGGGNASHGCVHLSYADARWFYNLSKQGDPVTITGTPRGKTPGDNGYADYNVPWGQWLAGSGMKQFTTHS